MKAAVVVDDDDFIFRFKQSVATIDEFIRSLWEVERAYWLSCLLCFFFCFLVRVGSRGSFEFLTQ